MNLKSIATTLALLGSGALAMTGCEKDAPATETPGGAEGAADAAEGSCGADKAEGEGSCGAEGEGSCGGEKAEGEGEGSCGAEKAEEGGEGSCGG